jgi:predicted AlkP superfamily pyrophosphatase or phosphodiesterase
MHSRPDVRRVILVVLDGLRADAIPSLNLRCWNRLARVGASSLNGRTVAPSVTAAAIASLLTGAPPEVHGLRSDHFHVPQSTGPVHPLPRVLADHGLPTSGFVFQLPFLFRGLGRQIARQLGIEAPNFMGNSGPEILSHARAQLAEQKRGLIFLHWPDCDRAGHATGWMSDDYVRAAHRLDESLGILSALAEVEDDPSTLLIALADHGGGGKDPRNHDSAHVLDRTIPILMVGGGAAGELVAPSLLDVPATILWALGVDRPHSYAGRPLVEAFAPARMAVA